MELFGLVLLVLLIWLWFDSQKVREIAVHNAREACHVEGLQFLDDTVAITSLKLERDDAGRLRLQRAYSFEYSDTGNNRLNGSVVMLGEQVMLLNVGLRPARGTRENPARTA